jgi:hypothetical protein
VSLRARPRSSTFSGHVDRVAPARGGTAEPRRLARLETGLVKAALLAGVFAVHAVAFGWFWVRRGRRAFNLLFFAGFALLALFYAYSAWVALAGGEPEGADLRPVRWAGLLLCAVATPPFVIHAYRGRRAGG